MTRYRVTISHDACTTHDVVADSPEDAGERAMEGCGSVTLCHHCSGKLAMGDPIRAACVENLDDGSYIDAVDHEIGRLLATLIAIESAFTQKCADTWCTSRNAETLETARAAIAAAGGKVSRNTEPER